MKSEDFPNASTMSISTAKEYLLRLNNFKDFVAHYYQKDCSTINDLISKIKKAELDPYSVLN
jgi:hypothetical protein